MNYLDDEFLIEHFINTCFFTRRIKLLEHKIELLKKDRNVLKDILKRRIIEGESGCSIAKDLKYNPCRIYQIEHNFKRFSRRIIEKENKI